MTPRIIISRDRLGYSADWPDSPDMARIVGTTSIRLPWTEAADPENVAMSLQGNYPNHAIEIRIGGLIV